MYQVYHIATQVLWQYSMNYDSIIYKSSIATYDIQSIDITSSSGEVCVVCRFWL